MQRSERIEESFLIARTPVSIWDARDFDCDVYPRVGILIGHHAFDLSISNSRREVNHYFVSDNFYFLPGDRPPPLPSPLGLDIDRCIITSIFIS